MKNKIIKIIISLDVRIMGYSLGFCNCCKNFFTVMWELYTKGKTAAENALAQKNVYRAGHVQTRLRLHPGLRRRGPEHG